MSRAKEKKSESGYVYGTMIMIPGVTATTTDIETKFHDNLSFFFKSLTKGTHEQSAYNIFTNLLQHKQSTHNMFP